MASRTASREEVWTDGSTLLREMVVNRLTGLLRDLEANWASCFALANGGSINGVTIRCDIRDS